MRFWHMIQSDMYNFSKVFYLIRSDIRMFVNSKQVWNVCHISNCSNIRIKEISYLDTKIKSTENTSHLQSVNVQISIKHNINHADLFQNEYKVVWNHHPPLHLLCDPSLPILLARVEVLGSLPESRDKRTNEHQTGRLHSLSSNSYLYGLEHICAGIVKDNRRRIYNWE